MNYPSYQEFFKQATGFEPYPYQLKLAEQQDFPQVLKIPTGTGKTSSIVIAWVWKLLNNADNVPRRLIYCLPMRSIVEQVRDNINLWLKNIECDKIRVITIMGGENTLNWDLYPEDWLIIIGTQEMLISRALNRGYGMSKYRWPMQFSLLNNDSLWVMDETQLMGNGLYTTIQLQYFREKYGNFASTQSIWMSATIYNDIKTVDFEPEKDKVIKLSDQDYKNNNINKVLNAVKILKIKKFNNIEELIRNIIDNKDKKIIVIVNNVKSSVLLYNKLKGYYDSGNIVLLHSHFRRGDKNKKVELAKNLSKLPGKSIIISTQVIEAGMDISCELMYTEAAPISSLIQRFGRCNRFGEHDNGQIVVINNRSIFNTGKETISPYNEIDVKDSLKILDAFNDKKIDLKSIETALSNMEHPEINTSATFLRDNDIIELFDTSADISSQNMDISMFVRNFNSDNVFVFWRDINENNINIQSFPSTNETCPVNITDIKNSPFAMYRYNFLEGEWEPITNKNAIIPGSVILMNSHEGGYNDDTGYSNTFRKYVTPISPDKKIMESYSSDESSEGHENNYMTLKEHTEQVMKKCDDIINQINSKSPILDNNIVGYITKAAMWHDAGKAHDAFQAKFEKNNTEIYAKAPPDKWIKKYPAKYDENLKIRKYFRHELASGLLALQNGEKKEVAYLAAAHHGKIRLSISSIDGEYIPGDNRIFAKGVWDKDIIPPFNLTSNTNVPETILDMSIMQIGSFNSESWIQMAISLYKKYGIFKLAYMETIVRAADQRASGNL